MLVLKQITVITFFRTIYVLKSCFLFRPILWWILNHHASRPLPNPWGHDINNKIKRPVREIFALHSNKVESPSLIDACSVPSSIDSRQEKRCTRSQKNHFLYVLRKKKLLQETIGLSAPTPTWCYATCLGMHRQTVFTSITTIFWKHCGDVWKAPTAIKSTILD